ncbi:ABC transporter ATP-binding protein [Roseateles cellulosilyticus]|uniref:ATP-binding cassette domain-containing protein n=1 Tax=Pelomonas cellulosilytica TaxID=2906762 RepID=A0ABS8XSV8_9BURK|nr:ATP-binding cassette domain-containing protein [Pelomonas sp. P8]MCE4553977.1 ATP-binding cassette domain-containing protein [Pelomonas sp. P8]
MTAPVLAVQGLQLGHAGQPQPLVDSLDLQLQAGEIVALLGASGCGKSSLLRVLAGLERPWAGEIRFQGEPLTKPHPRAGLLFQRPGLLPWLSCAGNVGFGLGFRHQPRLARAERQARVAHALADVGLADAARRFPAQLSGGMAQRAALARALAREPLLLLADEPFSALDAITREEMQALLRRLVHASNTATLLVTHDVDEALALADRLLLLGRAAPGEPARLLQAWGPDRPAAREPVLQALRASSGRDVASDPLPEPAPWAAYP